jgi:hypothetical protein
MWVLLPLVEPHRTTTSGLVLSMPLVLSEICMRMPP